MTLDERKELEAIMDEHGLTGKVRDAIDEYLGAISPRTLRKVEMVTVTQEDKQEMKPTTGKLTGKTFTNGWGGTYKIGKIVRGRGISQTYQAWHRPGHQTSGGSPCLLTLQFIRQYLMPLDA